MMRRPLHFLLFLSLIIPLAVYCAIFTAYNHNISPPPTPSPSTPLPTPLPTNNNVGQISWKCKNDADLRRRINSSDNVIIVMCMNY